MGWTEIITVPRGNDRELGVATPTPPDAAQETRHRLFTKYVGLFVAVVSLALLANGVFEVVIYYQEHKSSLVRIQREQAEAAAATIGQFIHGIESQLGWTTQLPWPGGSMEQRRFDALRLLRQVPAITELSQLDASGRERLRVSRLAMDVVNSGLDASNEPRFTEAVERKVYYGPVYFRRESEPYMTLAIAGPRRDAGVSVAEVNLKLIWDVVSQIKVGRNGLAYVVDQQGRLIAHPDISLVLRNTDMSALPQVRAARDSAQPVQDSKNIQGQDVLTASAPIAPLGWQMFVELPAEEAHAPLYAALRRLALVLTAAMVFAVLAGMLLARRMVGPIQAISAGAARIGSGELSNRIDVRTGDELEALAGQFNVMAGRLQESYADLERKVDSRTRDLAQSVRELRALGEVSQAVNSTLDLDRVLATIVSRAVQISATDAGSIYVYDDARRAFHLSATFGMSDDTIAAIRERSLDLRDLHLQDGVPEPQPAAIPDLRLAIRSPVNDIVLHAGFLALLIVPLLRPGRILGALVVRRRRPGDFPQPTVELLKTFAAQSVLAIQNARLFHEIDEKGHQLAVASRHKSQFLANMSHELRTPLNAILGYTELILDGIYGEAPEKIRSVVARVEANGRHLLGLINDVLDLSKIEAGQLSLSVADYSLKDLVHEVFSAVEPLASEKNIALRLDLAPRLPPARGDERRLMQVLLNLVGNAIKFTDRGEVAVSARAEEGLFHIAVRDTGPGISVSDQQRIFDEFVQADGSVAGKKGGTGLGLSIARRIVAMHGGRLYVESAPGQGSTFVVEVPVTVHRQAASQ